MEDEIKSAKKGLTSKIKGQVRKTEAYTDFNKHLKKWAIFTELLIELKDPSMIVDDDRHWQAVRDILKKQFQILPDSYLSELWQLNI
jgi:hypothetical protein